MTPPSFHRLVDEYLTTRRGLGFDLETAEGLLRDFASHADRIGHDGPVTIELAVEWARSSRSSNPAQAVRRLTVVRQFARYCARFDPATEVPPAGLLGRVPRRSVPERRRGSIGGRCLSRGMPPRLPCYPAAAGSRARVPGIGLPSRLARARRARSAGCGAQLPFEDPAQTASGRASGQRLGTSPDAAVSRRALSRVNAVPGPSCARAGPNASEVCRACRPWIRRRHCEQWPTSMSKRRTSGRTGGRSS